MAKVFIPPLLRELTGGVTSTDVEGRTLRQIIRALDVSFPGVACWLLDGDKFAAGIAVSIDGVLATGNLFVTVGPDSEIHFLPAIAGG